MTKPEHEYDHDNHDRLGAANDNNAGGDVAPAPASGALTSLAALGAVLNKVDTRTVVGRSRMPMLHFKREGSGTWQFGQRGTIVEPESKWAVNPTTFTWGFICFSNDNKVVGEHVVSVSQPKPDIAELPDKGFDWTEQWGVNLKCLDGADAATEVVYKPTTVGGIQAVAELIDAVRDRLNSGLHDNKVAPIVQFDKSFYTHAAYGRVWTPVMRITDWMPLNGPAPAPKSTPPSSPPEQPRRRRVA